MASACGEYPGEVIVDNDGNYLGDFAHGMAIDAPLGFSRSMAYAYGLYPCGGLWWFYSPFWVPPWVMDECNATPQPDVPFSVVTGYVGLVGATLVTDDSGPAPAGIPALDLDFSGYPSGHLAFIGETASQHAGYDPADYAGAWLPEIGSCWIAQCWAKAVPDDAAFVATGASVDFGYGRIGWGWLTYNAGVLTEDWQFFQRSFTIQPNAPDGVVAIPIVGANGNVLRYSETRTVEFLGEEHTLTKAAPHGRMRIKCFHLYPCVTPPPQEEGIYVETSPTLLPMRQPHLTL